VLIAETGPVAERLRVREIDDDEGRRLVRIVRRGTGSVVTWRRAQMVLLSAQGMDVAAIAKVAFTSEDRVRDVIRNFNTDGFSSLYPKYKGGRRSSRWASGGRSRRSPSPARPTTACRFPPGACRSWPSSWWLRGWSTTSAMRACGCCSARRASPFNG
jgi:hypothetical protein